MSWRALDVRAPEERRNVVAAWLVKRTGQAVEERADGALIGFAGTDAEAESVLQQLRIRFGSGIAAAARALPEVDWSERWRDGLGPRRIGRLTVTPSWSAAPASSAPTVIIDPETAFGTGEHGSTRTALLLLDRQIQPGDRVLDLGSGSGILAIAAVKLGAARATGIEIDPDNESVARANAARNGVADRAGFVTGDARFLGPLLGPVEIVLSNILRSVNLALLPVIRASLTAHGCAIFAGMEQPERELFLPALTEAGFAGVDEASEDAWWGVAARVR